MIIEDPDKKLNEQPIAGSSSQPPPYSLPTPSTSSSQSQSVITSPLSSPPPTTAIFSRQPSRNTLYPNFKPIFLVALGKYLDKGFMRVIPPSHEQPHPFATHDVGEQDWLSFIDEITEVATLSEKEERRSTHLGFVAMIPVVNMVISHGIRSYFKSRKPDMVVKVIDRWNHHFFRPRKMETLLFRGTTKLSGATDRPIGNLHTPPTPDMSGLRLAYSEAIARPTNIYDIDKYKGQCGDDKDSTFRLFVVPLV